MDNALINNDCISVLFKLRSQGKKVQLTVTSPPYFNVRNYSHWETYDDYIGFLISVFSLVYDVTEDGRMC